ANSPSHNNGFQGFNSNLANINSFGLNMTYAYRYFGEGYNISIGADAGFTVQPNALVNNPVSLLSPFAGFGVAANTENFFLSASNPYFFVDETRLFLAKKPWFLMGGASIGDSEKLLVNVSSLVELNQNQQTGNGADLNAKVWLGGRAGLGVSYRMSGTTGFQELNNKVVFSLEYQFSTSIRMGLSFDQNPLQGIRFNQFGGSGEVPSVFQIAINYRALPKNIPMARFDYY
ncbi:MAG: type IX secretion system membrane protein PorP/SprF, partial [Spirosomaceae bacterium]|nr:type IX secretion system membrane protein PorP/SprF [Spirosomataceae bacterium]